MTNSTRPYTTLFLLQSLDGKISTGDTDERDTDKDLRHIVGIKEGLQQYYDLEQQTDLVSLNSGRVMAKIGVNKRTDTPQKIGVDFVIVDTKPHLQESGVEYISKWVKKLYIVTNNSGHPAYRIQDKFPNIEIIDFDTRNNPKGLLNKLYQHYGMERLTIQTGGTFNTTWIREGLIDEVSIVIAPMLVGGRDTQSLIGGESLHSFEDLAKVKALKLLECNQLKNSYLHVKYKVLHPTVLEYQDHLEK